MLLGGFLVSLVSWWFRLGFLASVVLNGPWASLRLGDGQVADLAYLAPGGVATWAEVEARARLSRPPTVVAGDDAVGVCRLHIPEKRAAYRHILEGSARRVEQRPTLGHGHYLAQLPPRHVVARTEVQTWTRLSRP